MICRMMTYHSKPMEKELQLEKEFIELAKAEMMKDPKLRPCRLCIHFDEEKGYCSHFKQPKMYYNYGASCFITSEVALRAHYLQERARTQKKQAKLLEKMDVMASLLNGASLIHEDITEMMEGEYSRLQIKAKEDDKTYQKNKKHLRRLQQGISRMKVALQDFDIAYRTYIGEWNDYMFKKEDGSYTEGFDRFIANAGFVATMYFAIHDKCLENGKNVEDIFKFLNGLEGRDLLEPEDLKRYTIRV